MSLIKSYLIIIIVLLSSNLFSQEKKIGLPEIKNYSRIDYKGDTQNWEINQDKKGNLYFANNKGLFQFDGSSWRKYSLPNSGLIRSFKIDESGKIFVGGNAEFGYFKPDSKGKMKYYSLSKLINKNAIKLIDIIWKTHLYNDEVIFQSFTNAYILKKGKLKILEAPSRFQFSFKVGSKLYIQDHKKGLLEYKNGKLIPLEGTTDLNNREIWAIFTLADNNLLIETINNGLFIYDFKKLTSWNTEANEFMKKNGSLGGTTLRNNFIVLNSATNGIIICDKKGKIIQHFNKNKGLQNNTVLTSFVDNKNNIWLGLDSGIDFINENSPITYFGSSYGISTVYASVVYKNDLYIATNQGLLYHSMKDIFNDNNFNLVSGTSGQAWNVQILDDQLFCASNKGALIIEKGQTVNSIDSKGYIGFKLIPNKPNYMIGCNYTGFAVFEKVSNTWQYKNQLEGFYGYPYSFQVENSNLWFQLDNLIYKMTLTDDMTKIKSIKTYKDLSNKDKGIGSIQQINQAIYFQTNNHFYKYSGDQDLFYEDKKISNLFKNLPKITEIKEDSSGNIWYVFKESLGALMKNKNGTYKNIITPFSNLTGNLVSNYLSVNTIDSENIFIGLTNGIAHYNPKQKNNFVIKPKAYIRSFSYPGDTLILGNGQKELEEYKIPYKYNQVKFSFSSPTFENLENVEFSYQLEGFDKKWSSWSNNNSIKEYTNLREGNYKMKIKVRNSYGVQSDETFLLFTISPPWYRHPLAYLIYTILIITTIYLIRKRIKMKIRKNKYYETLEQRRLYLEKETKIRQEQYELEKEIEKLKNDKLKIKILAKDKELVNNSLQVAKKNKVLNTIINKIKDINVDTFDETTKTQFTKLNRSIVKEVNADKSWQDLEKHIKNVHYDFLKRLKEKYPTISPRELDLATYLLMNMSTKEIAEVMNISNGGVELARYRLRKKLDLNKKENLIGFLMSI
ncbi:triple tyrosine motif-containing protein [Flavobacterium undicola]|uniref:triple tyrosine motif-containing protein n=1 Tax=Flavobacterium undicola TaxID=1932779 RepID=UPI0013778C6C|nr:triple tyrosine motif-containing protein [Flavobacterium undicola]MBA0885192.1 regulator [Flavobacterium undicola]